MGHDSDTAECGRMLTALRHGRHAELKKKNMDVLRRNGLPFILTNNSESALFRVAGRPKADFFPSTGRWRCEGKTYRGGAAAFLKWYQSVGIL